MAKKECLLATKESDCTKCCAKCRELSCPFRCECAIEKCGQYLGSIMAGKPVRRTHLRLVVC